ncbi:MAG: hypothetical protein KY432_04355 [Acidobacteria bacterium]|nr:hypothetical protein [Acidobacteriota bacterium]
MADTSEPQNSPPGNVRSPRFERVKPRTTVDYLMRTAQQHHVQISVMADTKANILITVCSIILTLALSQLGRTAMRETLLTLSLFTLVSLILAILAILPKYRKLDIEGESLPESFNLLFFGHFTSITRDRFLDEMERVLEDDARTYDTLSRDLYSIGEYLDRWKYRYLRWAYIALLVGFLAASIVSIWTLVV